MKNKNNEKVKHVSTKYNKVVELNKKYEFKEKFSSNGSLSSSVGDTKNNDK